MLPSRAVKKFLERDREDYRDWKQLSYAELDKLRRKLPIPPPIWKRALYHQRVCFLIGARLKRFGYLCDTGMGKSFISIMLIRYFLRLGMLGTEKKVLILIPNKINKGEWGREIRKHSPQTTYCILAGSSEAKWKQYKETDALVILDTYAGFTRMVCDVVPAKKAGKERLKPSPKKLDAVIQRLGGLILDESTSVKNAQSLYYRIAKRIGKSVPILFALTGTPFGREPSDLWAQIKLIDDGWSLGETLTLFRAAFYSESKNFWGGTDYKFKSAMQGKLNRMLAHATIRFEANEGDMPHLVRIKKEITLPHEANEYYRIAHDTLQKANGNYQEMKNAFMQLRQISSGFLGYKDEDRGVRAQIAFKPNAKLDLLLSIIDSIPEHKKILVFHDFIFSGSMIEQAIRDKGIKYLRLHQKVKDDELALMSNTFTEDKSIRVFILSTAGGFGLNLQAAQYGIFYESPVSVIMRKQMIRRFERQFSKHDSVFLYDLVVRHTVDEQILAFHKQGADLFRAIVEGRVPAATPFS